MARLIYLSTTRSDIPYVVGVVSRFMHDPREVCKRSTYYFTIIKTTPEKSILFRKGTKMSLEAYIVQKEHQTMLDAQLQIYICLLHL